ncbi:MAG: hypothetical protein WCX74_01410 [Candidatus Paceibacterota bacterium]
MKSSGFVINWIIVIVAVCILLLVGVVLFFMGSGSGGFSKTEVKENPENIEQPPINNNPVDPTANVAKEITDATFKIDNTDVKLADGKSGTISVFNDPIKIDINNDGIEDKALMLTDSSKKAYYVSAAIKSGDGYIGTNAISLNVGDMAPKKISANGQIIIIDYSYRRSSDPVFERLATSIRKGFVFENGILKEANASTVAEKGCTSTGGKVVTTSCCKTAIDFSNNCLIGACGCSPNNSKQVRSCSCSSGKCFDGNECITK